LTLARELKKTIYTLLLEGDPWWNLRTIQYLDVRNRELPPAKFFVSLANIIHQSNEDNNPNISINIAGDVQGNIVVGNHNKVRASITKSDEAKNSHTKKLKQDEEARKIEGEKLREEVVADRKVQEKEEANRYALEKDLKKKVNTGKSSLELTRKEIERKNFFLTYDFNAMTLVLIPVAVSINIVLGQIVVLLKLPIYLDSVGTILVGVLCGPWAGALTGALSTFIWGITVDSNTLPWWPVATIIGYITGSMAGRGFFISWWKVVITGFVVALTATIISTPISVYLYGGITASGFSFFITYLLQTGQGIISAVFSTSFLVEPVDKIVTTIMVFAIVQNLSNRFILRFPRPENVKLKGTL